MNTSTPAPCGPAQQATYIPNPQNVRVGYGWRLLAAGEIQTADDQFLVDGKWHPNWYTSIGMEVGTGAPHRRRIEPEPGYLAVGEHEATSPDGHERYICIHDADGAAWKDVDWPRLPILGWINLDTRGVLVTRPAAKAAPSLDDQIAATKRHLADLEAKQKERDEVKVGDWVVVTFEGPMAELQKGRVYRIRSRSSHGDYLFEGQTECLGTWNVRKATPAEVKAHLAAQEVTVTVNGTHYRAGFSTGVVVFGCAKIDNRLIRAAHELTQMGERLGNRTAGSVKIGAGEFTHEVLAKLVKQLKD